ncbi:hypothetical protein ABKN59_005747 [Abortiporus biennis]
MSTRICSVVLKGMIPPAGTRWSRLEAIIIANEADATELHTAECHYWILKQVIIRRSSYYPHKPSSETTYMRLRKLSRLMESCGIQYSFCHHDVSVRRNPQTSLSRHRSPLITDLLHNTVTRIPEVHV